MSKRNFVAYLDSDLIKIAQSKGINLSQLFNEVLKNITESPERLEELDEQILKEKILKLTDELNAAKSLFIQIDEAKHGKVLSEQEVEVEYESEKKDTTDGNA